MSALIFDHYPLPITGLPPGWIRTEVGACCVEIAPGFASGIHNRLSAGIPHLRPMNVSTLGRVVLDDVKFVSRDAGAQRISGGDVLFNNTNSAVLVGKTALISGREELAYSNHMTRLRPHAGIDPGFLAGQLHFLWMSGYFLHRCVKHVNQASVSSTTLAETVPLVVPPTSEQRRTVETLDSYLTRLDAATDGLARVGANLKRHRASVLKAAVEGRLVATEAEIAKKEGREYEPASNLLARILKERRRSWETRELAKMKARGISPSTDTWTNRYRDPAAPDTRKLPALPEGWCWATVQMVGDVLLGRQRAPQFLTGRFDRPYLRVANIKDDRIDLSDIESMDFDQEHFHKYRLAPDDILVSEGQSPHLVGQSAIYRGEGPAGLCFQKTLHRFRPVAGGPSAEFAQLVFRSHVKSGVFQRLASITTNIAHLTLEKFEAAPFPLPPVPEQERIATEVARILSDGDAVEAAVVANAERIVRLRQSILKWAFEGKLVDQDPSEEPASVLLDRIRRERLATDEDTRRPTRAPARKTA